MVHHTVAVYIHVRINQWVNRHEHVNSSDFDHVDYFHARVSINIAGSRYRKSAAA
jgi:hypothetical protein